MPPRVPTPIPLLRSAGFAMLDVLVALLLLAVTLAGACGALIHTMRSTHAALLTSQAVDLVAELGEALREAPSSAAREELIDAWRVRVATLLPVQGINPDEIASLLPLPTAEPSTPGARGFDLTLRWHNVPATTVRELKLPLVLAYRDSAA